jgi:hypothetical protein
VEGLLIASDGSGIANLRAANVTGTVATAGVVTNPAQVNITSVGTLSSLGVTNQVTASQFIGSGSGLSSIQASNIVGTVLLSTAVTGNAQPNITSLGILSNLAVSNSVTTGNVWSNSLSVTALSGKNPVQFASDSGSFLMTSGGRFGFNTSSPSSQIEIGATGASVVALNLSDSTTGPGNGASLTKDAGQNMILANQSLADSWIANFGSTRFRMYSSGGQSLLAPLYIASSLVTPPSISTTAYVQGNAYVSNSISTTNIYANQAYLSGLVLTGSISATGFSGGAFTGGTFQGTTISGTVISASTDFTGLAFYGYTYSGYSFSATGPMTAPSFSGTAFNGGTFSGTTITASTGFTGTAFSGGTFQGSSFASPAFTGTAFTGGTFNGTTMSGTTITASTGFTGTAFSGGTFQGSSFASPSFTGTAYTGGTFYGTTITASTGFTGAAFTGGTFQGSSFSGTTMITPTANITSANVTTQNVGSLNVFTGANITTLTVSSISNAVSANILTANILSANIQTENIFSINVSLGANITTLTSILANIATLNTASANITTENLFSLNVYTGANISTLTVSTFANIVSANIVTINSASANVTTENVSVLNVWTGANISTLTVTGVSNLQTLNATTTTMLQANIYGDLGANLAQFNLMRAAQSNIGNIYAYNVYSANIYSYNVGALNSNISYLRVTSNILPGAATGNTYLTGNIIVSGNVYTALGELGTGGSVYYSLGSGYIPSAYTGAIYGQAYTIKLNNFTPNGSSTYFTQSANGFIQFSQTGMYQLTGVFLTDLNNINGIAIGSNVIDYGTMTDQTYLYRYTTTISQNPTEPITLQFYVGSTTLYYYVDLFAVGTFTLQQTTTGTGGTWMALGPYNTSGTSGQTLTISTLGNTQTGLTTTYSALVSDYYIGCKAGITVNLPTIGLVAGKQYVIKDESGAATTSHITIAGGGNLIDGQTSLILVINYAAVTLYWTGTSWSIV